ncbi:MAG: MBL fold metallo-hydrolase [Clostridia bacterium]|nr:MBL fold metallo-hydrolase [Clostridia bacterium]
MGLIKINDRICYIEASDDPLCADIGVVRAENGVWLYDVGNGEKNVAGLTGSYNIVLSHFHRDHTGNLDKLRADALYVSGETFAHVNRGTVVESSVSIGSMRIFPIPSSHTKGCLGLEADEEYAFVGDALYSKVRDGFYVYNAQLLQAEIEVLKALKAPYLLVSHFRGLVRDRKAVLEELGEIYAARDKNSSEIRVRIENG